MPAKSLTPTRCEFLAATATAGAAGLLPGTPHAAVGGAKDCPKRSQRRSSGNHSMDTRGP